MIPSPSRLWHISEPSTAFLPHAAGGLHKMKVLPENLPALSICQVKSRGKSMNFTAKEVQVPSYEYGLVAITKSINISEKKAPYINSLILRDN